MSTDNESNGEMFGKTYEIPAMANALFEFPAVWVSDFDIFIGLSRAREGDTFRWNFA